MKTKEEIEQLADEYATSIYGYNNKNHNAYLDCKKHCIDFYTKCQNDMLHDQTVTRFDVIDENGRVHSQWNCKVELSYQDDGNK